MQISNQEKQLLITLIWSQYRQDYYQIRNPCIILSAPFLSSINNIFIASRSHIEIQDWFIISWDNVDLELGEMKLITSAQKTILLSSVQVEMLYFKTAIIRSI